MKMLRKFSAFLPVLLFGAVLMNCGDCNDCGPLMREPTVTMKFINKDCLMVVSDSILNVKKEVDGIKTSLAGVNTELKTLNDSLENLEVQISAGNTSLEETKSKVEAKTKILQTTLDALQDSQKAQEAKIARLNSIQSSINNGLVKVDSLFSIIDKSTLIFGSDSLERYSFPLSINQDSTLYNVFIAGASYDLTFQYTRNLNEDEKSNIEVVISGIRVKSQTFDDVITSCEACRSNETTVTVFF